jgi:hypothetical protein
MADSSDQHDTLALTRPDGAAPAWPAAPAPAAPAAHPMDPAVMRSMPGSTAWSQVPPYFPVAPAPVIVMRNNAAVVGATLGSVALFLSVIPLIGIVAWVLAPLGLLTSGAGLMVGISRQAGRVGAVYGLVTSGVALIICFAWLALLLAL